MYLTPRARVDDYTARGWWGGTTVDDLLQRARAETPQRIAIVDPANREALDGGAPCRLTWAQLGDEVDRAAAALLALGLAKDDILALQAPNTVDTVTLILACARLGLIVSPAPMQYREHELAYILDQLRPAAFLTVPRFAGHDHAVLALRLREGRPGYAVIVLGEDAPAGAIAFGPAVRAADPARAAAYHAADPVQAGEVFTLCWTSGTEARPKGVPRDHNHWLVSARTVTEASDLRDGEVLLNPFPMVNMAAFGIAMSWLWRRATMVLHHPFDLGVFLRQIRDERVNYTITAPAILNGLLKNEALLAGADLSSLRAIGSGSAPLSPWMIQTFKGRFGIEVANIFGSNEGVSLCSSHLTVPDPVDRARYFPRWGVEGLEWDAATAGMVRTRLVDPATEQDVTAPGIPGELRIDGAATFSGYWQAPHLNETAFDAEGFFKTGDLFEIAGEGPTPRFYRFVGRCKEIIVRGGVNISPAEIDDLLAGWPAAKEAAVVGVPDEILGERMCLAVVPAGAPPTLDDAKAWLSRTGLAVYKLPERLALIDALPRNAMNKIVRAELRAKVLGG